MRVITVGRDKIMVEITRKEFEGITGRYIVNQRYLAQHIEESDLEGAQFDLDKFISLVKNLQCAAEARDYILSKLESCTEIVENVLFPITIIKGKNK